MIRFALLVAFSAASSASFAGCGTLDAVFENEHASSVLAVLATEAGLTLVNPELARGRIDATFESEDPGKLLPILAWDLGFELHLRGRKAWLHEAAPVASQAHETTDAGI